MQKKNPFFCICILHKGMCRNRGEKADFLCISVRASVYWRVRRYKVGKKMTHERSKKGSDGTDRRILILPGSNGDSAAEKVCEAVTIPVFSFWCFYFTRSKRNPRRVVQHVDDAAPFKSVFLDQMLHDLIVRMRIDAQVRDLLPSRIDDLGEKSVDCSV